MGEEPTCCPLYHEAVELIGRRWTGAIVEVLLNGGAMRFSEIAAAVPELSDRLLSERMKELEARGVVELDEAFESGMGFDGSSITGFNAIEESDMIAMPDPGTFAVLPWRPDEQGVGRMFCDVVTPERTPYEGDPRHVLRRALLRAEALGLDTLNVGPELEYFLFKDSKST